MLNKKKKIRKSNFFEKISQTFKNKFYSQILRKQVVLLILVQYNGVAFFFLKEEGKARLSPLKAHIFHSIFQ